jgi:hypothetical protein
MQPGEFSMIALLGILALAILGGIVVRWMYSDGSWLIVVSLAFPVGAGIITLIMFLLNVFGFKWNTAILVSLTGVMLIAGAALCAYKAGGLVSQVRSIRLGKINPTKWYLFGLIATILAATLIAALYWPVSYWDDVGLYDLRGKIWADTGTINTSLMKTGDYSDYLKSASPMVSLLHSWFYQHGGENPHVLHFLFLVSLCVYCYAVFLPERGKAFAALGTLLVLTMPEVLHHGMIAYTNLPALIFFVAGIYPLTQRKVSARTAIFLGFLLGLTGWTRYLSEPPVLASLTAVFVVAFLQSRIVRWDVVWAGGVFLAIDAIWIVYQVLVLGGLSASYANGLVPIAALLDGRIFALVGFWIQTAGAPGLFGGTLVLFLFALLWDRAQSERPLLVVILAVWLAWMLTFLVVDQGNLAAFVLASGFRVWMPGAVLIVVWVARSRFGKIAAQQLERMTNQSAS